MEVRWGSFMFRLAHAIYTYKKKTETICNDNGGRLMCILEKKRSKIEVIGKMLRGTLT